MNYWQRWIGAWKKKTASLSILERGVYTEMLDTYYANEGPLPANEDALFRIVGAMTKAEQDAVRAVKSNTAFFTELDGFLHNERADLELSRWATFCEAQRNRRIGKHGEPRAEPKAPRANGESFTPPEWLNAETWASWIKIRPAKARTPDAQRAAVAKLDKFRSEGIDPNACIADSLANGWQGLFKPDKRGLKTSLSEANKAAGEEAQRRFEEEHGPR